MNLLELAQAKERGERIELFNHYDNVWKMWDGFAWQADWKFRIAPKKLSLVEELRANRHLNSELTKRAADRIEELEKETRCDPSKLTNGELIHELKLRMAK